MKQPKVTVIIVSYNTKDKLRRCLAAIEDEHAVVVIDNASCDGSPEMVASEFPRVHLIRNTKNIGFGAANNLGMDAATTEFVLFLNSDAYAHPGAISRLAQVFSDTSVVAAGGRLLNPDGSLQNSSSNKLSLWVVFCEQTLLEKAFPRSTFLSPYWNSSQFDATASVAQVMGACLMMPPVARFDERFFLYCEDTELCHRLSKLGQIFYVPKAVFTHDLGASGAGTRWQSIALYNRGKELYFRIHHGRLASTLCFLMDRMGAFLRLCGWTVLGLVARKGAFAKSATFWKVLTAPMKGPRLGEG